MASIDSGTLDQKLQNIQVMKAGFRQPKDRRNAFERVLRDYYDRLRTSRSPSQEDIVQSLHTLYRALNTPELVDQQLLIDFISVIVRFVENAGAGYAFSKAFIDRAIEVYQKAGFSPVDLYLTKADLLRLDQLESVEREQALMEAKGYAEVSGNEEMLLKVFLSCAVYYTEVSQYQKALQACQESEQLIERHSQLQKYKPKLLTFFGMNYTPLFKYQQAKEYLLQAKALLDTERDRWDEAESYDIWVSSMDTIHHYLGRIYEAEGHMQEAMRYYAEQYRYLQMFTREPRSRFGFFHLRLAELLISASLLQQARDHLLQSQEIFDAIEFSSSGRLQVSLAWAALYSKEGDYASARKFTLKAREEARNKHFPRGELWSLVKLFWLELGHLHLYRALVTALQALGTWRHGELRRNEAFRLFAHYLFQILTTPIKLLNRTPHTILGAGTLNAKLYTCSCPLHQLSASSSATTAAVTVQAPERKYDIVQ
jgi:tetratricopeptide (TPR) repeat protein